MLTAIAEALDSVRLSMAWNTDSRFQLTRQLRSAMKATLFAFLLCSYAVTAWAQSVPSSNDPRRIAWIDPIKTYSSYPKYLYSFQTNSQPSLTSIAEPGWWDPKVSQHTVAKMSDPANGSKKAIRHKIVKGGTQYGTTLRASILNTWGQGADLNDGKPYWAAFAFYVGPDHPFSGTGGELNILSLGHPVSSKNSQSMSALFLYRDGRMGFLVSSNSVLNGSNSTYKGTRFYKSIQKGVWHYIVVQCKYEWDVAKGPYTRVWHAVGNGAPVQWVNTNIANAFRESAGYHPWKFGIYAWDLSTGTNGIWSTSPPSSSRTLYTKGIQIFRDQPGTPTLSVNTMLALMRSM